LVALEMEVQNDLATVVGCENELNLLNFVTYYIITVRTRTKGLERYPTIHPLKFFIVRLESVVTLDLSDTKSSSVWTYTYLDNRFFSH
jgi:hypothetical protein